MQMFKFTTVLLIGAVAGSVAGWQFTRSRTISAPTTPPVIVHEPSVPTIEQVRELASLVTLRISLSDVQRSTLDGYTGGVAATLLVRGEVEVRTDLSEARFLSVDTQQRQATLALPAPTIGAARLTHTKILEIDRSGLWSFMPREADEGVLVNQAISHAKDVFTRHIKREGAQYLARARDKAEQVLSGFFNALGWELRIEWQTREQPPTA